MVRVWAPEVITILDDNRIGAAHAEIHYVLGALEKGTMWWRHPTTQEFYGREAELRTLHDMTVDELLFRGYRHLTPLEGERAEVRSTVEWIGQDLADLYRKWLAEERIAPTLSGPFGDKVLLGRITPKQYLNPRRPRSDMDLVYIIETAYCCSTRHPHREWTKADSAALKALIEREGRTPTNDRPEVPALAGPRDDGD